MITARCCADAAGRRSAGSYRPALRRDSAAAAISVGGNYSRGIPLIFVIFWLVVSASYAHTGSDPPGAVTVTVALAWFTAALGDAFSAGGPAIATPWAIVRSSADLWFASRQRCALILLPQAPA